MISLTVDADEWQIDERKWEERKCGKDVSGVKNKIKIEDKKLNLYKEKKHTTQKILNNLDEIPYLGTRHMFANSILQFQKQNCSSFCDPNDPFISCLRMNYFNSSVF